MDNNNLSNENKTKDFIMDVKKKLELKEFETQYKCCFGNTTDSRVLNFLSKFIIIFSILIFSFVMIIRLDNSSEKQIFIIIVNTILSIFLPSPSIKRKIEAKKDNNI